jgi:hypothetical protein
MAKLTQEDIDNYSKLKLAFSKRKLVDQSQNDFTENEVLENISILIINEPTPSNTDQLRQTIDLFDTYLRILPIIDVELSFDKTTDEIEKLKQEFSSSLENLKRSLKVIEDEILNTTDEVEEFQSDNFFLKFIEGDDPKKWTKTLINDRDPDLNEVQIDLLTQAWGTAVDKFVQDATTNDVTTNPVEPGASITFASFFRIHKELEILYSRLADSETVQLA